MLKKRLLWQLYFSCLLLTVIASLAIAWYTSQSFHQFYLHQVSESIKFQAHLIEQQILPDLAGGHFEKIDRLCKTAGPASSTRITIILPDGRVVADSDEQVEVMENHADRPEFLEALTKGLGRSERYSDTLGKNMMYLAIPIRSNNNDEAVVAVVRTSVPISSIDREMKAIYSKILWAVLIVAVVAAIISLGLSKRISSPIEKIKEAAGRYASGDLTTRLSISKPQELAILAKAMNKMAHQLSERINTITNQNAESGAILSSMIEGVIAVDPDGQIVRINRAAAEFLNIDAKRAERSAVGEAIYNAQVVDFIQKALCSTEPIEAEVTILGEEKRLLQLHGTRLAAAEGENAGAVIVLTDMTRIRQLQKVRRDFVANVSHELKTPITSIKGFVETLREGALKEPEQAHRFLEIIARHADRLNAIIDDLLALSQLEEDAERRALSFEMTALKPVLAEAATLSKAKAEEKQIGMYIECEETLQAQVNPALLEQAITNLINNAIKYSNPQSRIQIRADRMENEVRIAVQDEGCGIAQQDQERIFERFYVVDKSRSRKLGGTGLGLAIVKHISQVHHGYVTVESQLGHGSIFTIHLPLKETL